MTNPVRVRLPDVRRGSTRTFRLHYRDETATELAEANREIARLRELLAAKQIDPGEPVETPVRPVLAEFQFYVHANAKPDGTLGEVFIRGDRLGGFEGGALDALMMAISVGLQYGVPLGVYLDKLRGISVGPSGRTGDPEFPMCASIFDLMAQYLAKRFGQQVAQEAATPATAGEVATEEAT